MIAFVFDISPPLPCTFKILNTPLYSLIMLADPEFTRFTVAIFSSKNSRVKNLI